MAVLVVPARYASKRLPGKPLLSETGKPLVVHVIERSLEARRIDRALVATDDERIRDAVRDAGAEVVMTAPDRRCGTERVAEVAAGIPDEEFFVNLQGDEPEIDPGDIDRLVESLTGGAAPMATLAAPFGPEEDLTDSAVVKVVLGADGNALYFSRAAIPFDRDGDGPAKPLHHLGIYGFRRDALLKYLSWPVSDLERTERLEQLRALEHGIPIRVAVVNAAPAGIDTMDSYRDFVRRWAEGRGPHSTAKEDE